MNNIINEIYVNYDVLLDYIYIKQINLMYKYHYKSIKSKIEP